jgi:heme A synthase
MSGWFARWQERRRELAEGADADLMKVNRQRSRVAFGLMGLALLLGLMSAKVRVPVVLEKALGIASGICGVVGVVLAKWAQAEHNFLTKPEPESLPEIFRNRPR